MNTVESAVETRIGYTKIPNVLFDLSLDALEKIVLFALLSYKWSQKDCWPSQRTLSKDTSIPTRTLIRVLQRLRDKNIISYQRRGYRMSNRYEFLDPDLETMIARLLTEPTAKQKTGQHQADQDSQAKTEPEPLDFSCLLESNEPLLDLSVSLPIDSSLFDFSSLIDAEPDGAPQLSHEPTIEPSSQQPELDADPVDLPEADLITRSDQPDEPGQTESASSATMADCRSANLAQYRDAKLAHEEKHSNKEKTQKKRHTHERANARVCVPKSQFPLWVCIAFARRLVPEGITNPGGYGRTIWMDGSEDERIAEFASLLDADQQTATQQPAAGQQAELTNTHTSKPDPDCQHCGGFGLRPRYGFYSDEMEMCDCDQRRVSECLDSLIC